MKKLVLMLVITLISAIGYGQVTTSTISGVVKDQNGEALFGATVQATHTPTGTNYYSTTNESGVYRIPAVRVGGPYRIQVSYVGFKPNTIEDVLTTLGVASNVNIVLLEEATSLNEIVVVGNKNSLFSKEKTGAAQQFTRDQLTTIPITGARTIDAITKYNPNGNGSSFGAQDSRLNNFTIDGSVFNNGFGLGSSAQAGGRTGSSAISLDAIEQLQVNIAPFDIKQSGFTGAGINAVTRSGTNKIEGSVYQTQRDNSSRYVGNSAAGVDVTAAKFDEKVKGIRLGAPIVKDKLFFFGNFETLEKTEPGTNWISEGSPLSGSQISRVRYEDLTQLSQFMKEKFNYETGLFEGYNNANESEKFLLRFDWNINDSNKLTGRYIQHDSSAEINISNSQSAGNGNRTNQFNAMSFQNSGYIIMDNTRSWVLDLNSKFSDKLYNNLIVGYDKQIEDRAYRSQMFPTIDIKDGSATYTSVGFDPFTPGNKLDYSTFHVTNNLTRYTNKHTQTFGVNFETYESNNLFFPASNGVYVFNSLSDFYTAANQSLANGGGPSTFAPARFQFRYSALPGAIEPLQTLRTTRFDFYAQDEWDVNDKLKLTFGLRNAIISFDETAIENPAVTAMTFAGGEKFNTGKLPDTQLLWEPRFAFNYDAKGDQSIQFRGGTGVFTGRPPYVFISNQVGNNGVLTGFIDVSGANAANYGFTADPNSYFIPSTPTLPSTFDLAFSDQDYKFPQVWKTNIAVDAKLPLGLVGTAEYIYNKNINAVHYYNANLENSTGNAVGVDTRPLYARNDAGVRVNDNVSMAAVLTNRDGGYYEALTLKLEKPATNGMFGSFAWTTADARDFMSAGSIASGSWQGAKSVNGNNDLPLSFSNENLRNKFVGLVGFRKEYGKKLGGATSLTLGYIGQESGALSYFVAGDLNGDRVNNNDLIFVPNKGSDIKFAPLTVSGVTYTPEQQQDAFEKYIQQDPYLSTRRGQYAERGALSLPYLHRLDFSVVQDFNILVKGEKNSLQVRFDILNFGNMLNDDWGVSQRATNTQILTSPSIVNGEPVYKFATQKLADGSTVLLRDTYSKNSSVFDVWTGQLGLRYIFGR